MKRALKIVGMAVVLTALPVAFTGGSSGDSLGVKISSVCADDGPCAFAIGCGSAVCAPMTARVRLPSGPYAATAPRRSSTTAAGTPTGTSNEK